MYIEGTRSTPSVLIEPGKIKITGRSIPEDSFGFYDPVMHAIIDYFEETEESTEVSMHLEYINSGSKKFITNILSTCNEFYVGGKKLVIKWYFDVDDESMEELGHDLKAFVSIPFDVVEVAE